MKQILPDRLIDRIYVQSLKLTIGTKFDGDGGELFPQLVLLESANDLWHLTLPPIVTAHDILFEVGSQRASVDNVA